MQYKVPQNVEREDRIVGPLTLKQLIICTVGFGIAYSAYVYLGKKGYGLEVTLIPVLPTALITVAIAFVRINDIPFTKWVLLLIEFWFNRQKRVWVKGADTIRIVDIPKKLNTKKNAATKNKEEAAENIHRLVKILDSPDFGHINKKEEKIDKTDDKNLIHEAFTGASSDSDQKHKHLQELAAKPSQQKKQEELSSQDLKKGGEIKFD